MYQAFEGTTFRSVSTYLQNNSSWCQFYDPGCVRVRASHFCQNVPLISQSGSCDIMLVGLYPIIMKTGWPVTSRRKVTLPNLDPPAFYVNVADSLDLHGSSGSIFSSKTASKNNTVLLSAGKENMWAKNTNFQNRLDPENKEWVRSSQLGNVASDQGKDLLSLTRSPHHAIL